MVVKVVIGVKEVKVKCFVDSCPKPDSHKTIGFSSATEVIFLIFNSYFLITFAPALNFRQN